MNERIMIVEDEALIALSLKDNLESHGYNICGIYDNGEIVLNNLEEKKPDLILMDINLKGEWNGIETAEKINKLYDVPLLFLTSYNAEYILKKAQKVSPYGYIEKTINDKDIHLAIDRILITHNKKTPDKIKIEINDIENEVKIFSLISKRSNHPILYIDDTAHTEWHNECFEKIYEFKNNEIYNNNLLNILSGKDSNSEELDKIKKALKSNEQTTGKILFYNKSGVGIWNYYEIVPVQEDPKGPIRFILTLLDITSKTELSPKPQNPLVEKNIMMHEIHHRIKNNLQVIISMMDLELSRNNDEKLTKLLLKSKSRIRTISLIHEQLYQYDSLEKIEFSHYIRKLCSYIETLYSTINRSVTVQYALQKTQLNIYNAVPLALILNELLTNIYKHAFSNGRGNIFISFKENGDLLKLIVQDNGVGISINNKIENPTSLGYKLITGLVKQINGDIVIKNCNGTLVEINFKKELIQSSYGQSKSLLDQNN